MPITNGTNGSLRELVTTRLSQLYRKQKTQTFLLATKHSILWKGRGWGWKMSSGLDIISPRGAILSLIYVIIIQCVQRNLPCPRYFFRTKFGPRYFFFFFFFFQKIFNHPHPKTSDGRLPLQTTQRETE